MTLDSLGFTFREILAEFVLSFNARGGQAADFHRIIPDNSPDISSALTVAVTRVNSNRHHAIVSRDACQRDFLRDPFITLLASKMCHVRTERELAIRS